jgi:predicted nucleotidyltransferase component of viral defense system
MESSSRGKINLHFDFLPEETRKALDFLSNQEWLSGFDWYLAGGTALSLQAGHRKSVDLDFFTKNSNFNNIEVLNNFLGIKELVVDINKEGTIYLRLFNAKISFIAYPFFMPKQDFIEYNNIKILQTKDIAVMKIIAISQRGRKRDFIDLYWCIENIESLESIIRRLPEQYPLIAHDYHHILKSLVYFEDADNDPEPTMYSGASWKDIKDFFRKEVSFVAKKIIDLN